MITSVQNDSIKEYRVLCKKGKLGLVPLEGVRLICDALEAGVEFEQIFVTEDMLASEAGMNLQKFLFDRGLSYITISNKVAESMSLTKTPQGVFASAVWTPQDEECLLSGVIGMVVALDGVSDPGNVGTIIRTATAFGASAVILGGESARATSPKTIRASMGMIFKVPCIESPDLAKTLGRLKNEGFEVISADAQGISVDEASPKVPFVLVIGGEAFGISERVRKVTDSFISVPMEQKVESLNAAVAAGILMFSLSKGAYFKK